MLPWQREVTLFLSITYHKNLISVYIFLFCRTSYKKIGFSSLILTYLLDSEGKTETFFYLPFPHFSSTHLSNWNRLARPFDIQICPAKSVNSYNLHEFMFYKSQERITREKAYFSFEMTRSVCWFWLSTSDVSLRGCPHLVRGNKCLGTGTKWCCGHTLSTWYVTGFIVTPFRPVHFKTWA